MSVIRWGDRIKGSVPLASKVMTLAWPRTTPPLLELSLHHMATPSQLHREGQAQFEPGGSDGDKVKEQWQKCACPLGRTLKGSFDLSPKSFHSVSDKDPNSSKSVLESWGICLSHVHPAFFFFSFGKAAILNLGLWKAQIWVQVLSLLVAVCLGTSLSLSFFTSKTLKIGWSKG